MKLITTDGVRVSTDATPSLTGPSAGAVTKRALPDKNQTKPKPRTQAISTQQTVELYFALIDLIGAAERAASTARRARDALEQYEPEVSLADHPIEDEIF